VGSSDVSLVLAFGAGVLSFLSPCVLPLVPAYLSHLTGRAISLPDASAGARWLTFLHALSFVLGFAIVFTALGASVGLVGYVFYDMVPIFEKVGGVVLFVFGLQTLGVLKLPALYRELRLEVDPAGRWGLLSSLLVGAIFAAAWTPCVGPVLSGILVLAGTSGTVGHGARLLFAYSLGLGVPFLLVGAPLGWSSALHSRLKRYARGASVLSGVLLTVMGVLVFTGSFSLLTAYLARLIVPPL
jgi:cytochrome c-type biogenesis protein